MSQKQWMKVRTAGSDAPIHSRDSTCEASGCRPVVVLDPEGREQVERLRDLTLRLLREQIGNYEEDGFTPCDLANAMQAALREFADPQPAKPEEPTGLGAVVEDEDGHCWFRTDGAPAWYAPGFGIEYWSAINVVRVLSEGVQAGESA